MKLKYKRMAQILLVFAGAFAVKLYYSTASADDLRWILAPTTALVEVASGARFVFESNAGYISRELGFLIAASCAGVNFLITAFLTLTLMKLLQGDQSKNISWRFIPASAIIAYLTTLVANATRIYIALSMRRSQPEIGSYFGMNYEQVHRFEGVFIYFGFLLLLFAAGEKLGAQEDSKPFRRAIFPLIVYYAMMFGIPILTGAFRRGIDFWRHEIFVILIPLPLTYFSFLFRRLSRRSCLPPVFCIEESGKGT